MGRVVVIASVNLDHVVRCRALPTAGETVLAHETSDGFGGKGANQACAAVLVAPTQVVAAVGPDGAAAVEDLRSRGVDCSLVRVVDAPTGRATVVVDERGENLIVVEPGANALLTPADVSAALGSLEPGDVVLTTGEISAACAAAAGRAARAAGADIVHNLAPYAGLEPWLDEVRPVVVLNAVEAAQASDADDPAAALATRFGAAVVTDGGAGARVASGGIATLVPAGSVEVVDTTGAGDAFCGTLAGALARGDDLVTATRRAVAAASRSVTHAGARQDAKWSGGVVPSSA